MSRLFRSNHPFHLLLYLEWILLGVALLTLFVPFPRHHFLLPHITPRGGLRFPLGIFLSILALAGLGLKLPIHQSQKVKALYTCLGFLLCWTTVFMGGRFRDFFTPMLLIVVIRACLLFPWRQRLIVASVAYGSFLVRLMTGVQRIRPFPRAGPPPPWRGRGLSQDLLASLQLRSALLFGLVLVFVLLMVGALLTEHQSRTELAAANQRLRQYALMIENQATLQERNRIAREMHDSVGHSLTAQSIQLENVDVWMATDRAKASDHLAKARSLGKEALQNVRHTVATLRNNPLQGQSLSQALSNLTQEFERTTSIQVQFATHLETPVPREMAAALYRLVQEALTNVSKHSEATQVTIELTEQEMELFLNISDNGKGFLPEKNTTGFGLQGMQERTVALGGLFELQSQPQTGCHIQITIPRLGEA
ncbi:sensor histidine kinase [Acaryochloris sp. CCMEE 5410]|uniref:sensor histidine kinase n=1 Tax=Acaryochloris sp. CCMEE 5410 TaxID=310037 RepID=UPI0002484687|nr:sensor histidine kinase [Acaryochloris sp. CCMEE 5410]KAI9130865.1 sensor histidine kinase [Acaryochloris sp. CCMEE 5410]